MLVTYLFPDNSLKYGPRKKMPEAVAPLFSLTGWTTPLAATLPLGKVSINSSKTVSSVKLLLTLNKPSAMPLWTDHDVFFFVSSLSQSFFVLLDVVNYNYDASLLMSPFLESDAIPREARCACIASIKSLKYSPPRKSVRHSGWVWLGWSCDHIMHITVNASHHYS